MVMLEGEPDRHRMNETFSRLIDRHESLRTSFQVTKGQPIQKIQAWGTCSVSLQEISELSRFIRPFDLSLAPLLRVGLARLEDGRYLLMLDMHHIVTDGTSMDILVGEFLDIYGEEQKQDHNHIHIEYKDFCEWQKRLFDTPYLKSREEFWLEEFCDEIPILELPLDFPRPAVRDFGGRSLRFDLDRKGTEALKVLAQEQSATLYMVLLAVINVLMAKLSGQEDIVIGTPVAGRRHVDLEKIIGMFVNTLALRNYPAAGKPFKVFLAEVKEKTLRAFENQDYPFENLVDKAAVHRDTGRSPLFDVMFTFQESEMDAFRLPAEGIETNGLRIKPFVYEKKTAKFDLNTAVVLNEDKLFFVFDYGAKLFKEETIERFIRYFKSIISAILRNPDIQLYAIDILSEQEKQQLLVEFNDTETAFPGNKNLHQLFEEQAEKTPDHVGLVGDVGHVRPVRQANITYRQLNEQSDRLAGLLIEKGILADNIVGIMMERCIELIIGILGILKAGGAYLPLDPELPQERIQYMLRDSNSKILLEMEECKKKIIVNCQLLIINCKLKSFPQAPLHHSSFINHHSNLAYIIYTSGSTGKPKGVLLEQRSAVNYIWWAAKSYVKGERLNFPLYTSISFDLTVTSIFTPLITGNAMVIYGENASDKDLLIERIIMEDRAGVVKLTPSHLKMLRGKTINRAAMNLKRFIVGGENLDQKLALEIHELFNGKVEIYNEYGPTEAAVGCMIYKFDAEKNNGVSVPIGLPGGNVQVYLLDKNWGPVPSGVAGELYISGAGIARGYLNRPELTAEKFIKNRSYKTYFLYKTGDLARRLSCGNIEFLGRIDNQIKIRGFRVELGEIENRLAEHPEIKETVVLPARSGNGSDANYLCAYIVPAEKGNGGIQVSSLREYLSTSLPHYMIPSHFVALDRIPLTTSGKVDRRLLENYKKSRFSSQSAYAAPRTTMEKIIAETWQDVLKLEKIGVHDNFFDLGGNSFDIININNKLKEKLNREFPVVKAFTYPTIRSLAEYLDNEASDRITENTEIVMTEKMDKGKNRLKERSRRGKTI
jgi:tyrocidine synthetase-3